MATQPGTEMMSADAMTWLGETLRAEEKEFLLADVLAAAPDGGGAVLEVIQDYLETVRLLAPNPERRAEIETELEQLERSGLLDDLL